MRAIPTALILLVVTAASLWLATGDSSDGAPVSMPPVTAVATATGGLAAVGAAAEAARVPAIEAGGLDAVDAAEDRLSPARPPMVYAVDEDGTTIPNARLSLFDTSVAPSEATARKRQLLRDADAATERAEGVLDLDRGARSMGERNLWASATAEGFERVLVCIEPPLKDVRIVLRRLTSATCALDAPPSPGQVVAGVAVPQDPATGRWRWGRHLRARPQLGGWVVVRDRQVEFTGREGVIDGLVVDAPYAFHVTDDQDRGQSQFASPPCALRFATPSPAWMATVVFSHRVPGDGVVCWRSADSSGGRWRQRDVKAGAEQAVFPLGRQQSGVELFGIGDGWSFASPVERAAGAQGAAVVRIVEDRESVCLRGFDGNSVVAKQWSVGGDGRPVLVRISNDVTSPGLRCWNFAGGLIVRGLGRASSAIVIDWVQENALTQWTAGQRPAPLSRPAAVPLRVAGEQRERVDQLLAASQSRQGRWFLEQRLTHAGQPVWCEVERRFSEPGRLIADLEKESRWVEGDYRVRIIVDGNESVVSPK